VASFISHWPISVAVLCALCWLAVRTLRTFRHGTLRHCKDILDLALPVLALATLAHGFMSPGEVAPGVPQAPRPIQPAPPPAEARPFPDSGPTPYLPADAPAVESSEIRPAGEAPGLLRTPQLVEGSRPVEQSALPVATVSTPEPQPTTARVITPVSGGVALSDSAGTVVAMEVPVRSGFSGSTIIAVAGSSKYRALRACPDHNCAVIANLSKFAPLQRTGRKQSSGSPLGGGWVEVSALGPYCKRWMRLGATDTCAQWQSSSSLTGWINEPLAVPRQ
jgi:hypothetical protein